MRYPYNPQAVPFTFATPSDTYPVSANPWSATAIRVTPTGNFVTPDTRPAAQEFNFWLGNLRDYSFQNLMADRDRRYRDDIRGCQQTRKLLMLSGPNQCLGVTDRGVVFGARPSGCGVISPMGFLEGSAFGAFGANTVAHNGEWIFVGGSPFAGSDGPRLISTDPALPNHLVTSAYPAALVPLGGLIQERVIAAYKCPSGWCIVHSSATVPTTYANGATRYELNGSVAGGLVPRIGVYALTNLANISADNDPASSGLVATRGFTNTVGRPVQVRLRPMLNRSGSHLFFSVTEQSTGVNAIYLSTSVNGGTTWTDRSAAVPAAGGNHSKFFEYCEHAQKLVCVESLTGVGVSNVYTSADFGATWVTGPVDIPSEIVDLRRLANGTLVALGKAVASQYYDPVGAANVSCWNHSVFTSQTGGATWDHAAVLQTYDNAGNSKYWNIAGDDLPFLAVSDLDGQFLEWGQNGFAFSSPYSQVIDNEPIAP